MPVNSTHPDYDEFEEMWKDCQIFFNGEKDVKRERGRFLPRPEQATDQEYANYIHRAFFFPGLERTVMGLAGIIDRKAPVMKLPDRISYLQEDSDNESTPLRLFTKRGLIRTFIHGRFGILIDIQKEGGKPYFSIYHANDIINWIENEDGLQLVVLRENYTESDAKDIFVQKTYTRYRVLLMEDGKYKQQIYTQKITRNRVNYVLEQTIEPTKHGYELDHIPFVFSNVNSVTSKIEKPPLYDLVLKNAECYRVGADYANTLYFTGNPILWVKGVKQPGRGITNTKNSNPIDEFKLVLGSSRAVYLPKEESQIGLVECYGHGVNPNRDRFADTKAEMAVIGARMLETQRTGVEAAETARLRQNGEISTLTSIVLTMNAAILKALAIADQWLGGDGKGIEFKLNDDFVDVIMDASLMSYLTNMVDKGYMSWETLFYNLAVGELIPEGRTAEQEKQLIEAGTPIGEPNADSLDDPNPPLDGLQDPDDYKEPEDE